MNTHEASTKIKSKVKSYRKVIQTIFFVVIALIATNHALQGIGITIPFISTASLHAICPFGGVVSIYQYLVSGIFVRKIHESAFILMGLVFILSILFGSVFCGWVCPLGTFQEWISNIGKKIFKKKHNNYISTKLDRYLRFLRYIVLGWVIYMTAITGKLAFSDYDPYNTLFNFWTDEVAISGIIILSLTVILSLFIERPFCKYGCPYGALLGISNRFRIVKLLRRKDNCIGCKKCNNVCPMNIDVASSNIVNSHQCISCYKCTSENACPIENTLEISTKKILNTNFRFKESLISLIVLSVIMGGIGLTMWFNIWQSVSGKEPARYIDGELLGEYNPADIRGSYTFSETSTYFNIPVSILAEAFNIPVETAANFQNKELESLYPYLAEKGTEIGNGSIKFFVALYNQLPYEVTEPVYLLEPAVNILKNLDTLTNEQIEYIQSHMIPLSEIKSLNNDNNSNTKGTLEVSHDTEVKITGKSTFKDLLDIGITQEQIEQVINHDMPEDIITVKDFCMNNDLNFSTIKEELTKYLGIN